MLEKCDLSILIVDDDEVDVVVVRRALKKRKIDNPVFVAHDGLEALEMLRRQDGSGPQWPYLILLDINMPRMSGIEFLGALRDDPNLQDAVVFVLSTSDDDRDMTAAYRKNIAGYVVKQNVDKDFMQLIELVENFSLVVRFPKRRWSPENNNLEDIP